MIRVGRGLHAVDFRAENGTLRRVIHRKVKTSMPLWEILRESATGW